MTSDVLNYIEHTYGRDFVATLCCERCGAELCAVLIFAHFFRLRGDNTMVRLVVEWYSCCLSPCSPPASPASPP